MADKTSILDKIKALFADTLPTTYKLADGTDVTISLLDVGGDFTMGGVPAPAGTYTLMDGTNVIVDATGKITSVEDPSAFADTEYTLADGTKCTIDKVEVGGKVMQGDQAAPDGDLKLQDGRILSVQNGLITEVKPAEGEVEMEQEQAPAPMTPEAVNALIDERVKGYRQGIESGFKLLFDAQALELKQTKETLQKALELMTQLAELPSEDVPPIVKRKVIFSGEVTEKKKKGLERYAAAAKKLAEQNSN